MKRRILHIAVLGMIALALCACRVSSVDGGLTSDPIPAGEIRLTDVGNSEEPDGLMKNYYNDEFEVGMLYSGSWDIEEDGTEQVFFSSEAGEGVTAAFEWTPSETLADFLGDLTDLIAISTKFDESLCYEGAADDEGFVDIECYHLYAFEKGTFVLSIEGTILADSPELEATPYGVVKVDHKRIAEITVNAPQPKPAYSGSDASRSNEDDVVTLPGPRPVAPIVTAPLQSN